MQKRFDLIVRGHFNTVVNLGPRGDLLNELMAMFDLQIGNNEEFAGDEHQWTFCSSGGVKRRIDFVLHGLYMITTASAPSKFLDLGSDHRAILVNVSIRSSSLSKSAKRKRKRQVKGWKPIVDVNEA